MLCFLSQIDVACGKNGAVSGISSGKGYLPPLLILPEIYVWILLALTRVCVKMFQVSE